MSSTPRPIVSRIVRRNHPAPRHTIDDIQARPAPSTGSAKVERGKRRAFTLPLRFAGQSSVDSPRDGYPNMGRLASPGGPNLFLLNDHYRRRVYRTISLPLYSDCREGKGSPFVTAEKHVQSSRG